MPNLKEKRKKKIKDIRGKILKVGDIVFYPNGRAFIHQISNESFYYVAEYLDEPRRVWLRPFYWRVTKSQKWQNRMETFLVDHHYNADVNYGVEVLFKFKDNNDPPEPVKEDMWTPDQRSILVNGIIRLRP